MLISKQFNTPIVQVLQNIRPPIESTHLLAEYVKEDGAFFYDRRQACLQVYMIDST